MTAPTNPFYLGTHLIDDHHQAEEFVDQLDADAMREYHDHCHTTGQPDHRQLEQLARARDAYEATKG